MTTAIEDQTDKLRKNMLRDMDRVISATLGNLHFGDAKRARADFQEHVDALIVAAEERGYTSGRSAGWQDAMEAEHPAEELEHTCSAEGCDHPYA